MLAALIAQAGDVPNGTSLAVIVVAVITGIFSLIGHLVSGYFNVKTERRLTRIETLLENRSCDTCEPKKAKRCWHPEE